MQAHREALVGKRILVVEDQVLIAMLVEETLQDLGCELVGPVATLEDALAAVRQYQLDGALLDANLRGENTSRAAEALAGNAVPFILVTGYARRDADPPAFKAAPRVQKPFEPDDLANRMVEIFGGGGGKLEAPRA